MSTRNALYSGTQQFGSPTFGGRSFTMSPVAYSPAQPKWCVMPTWCTVSPLTVNGLKRGVTRAITSTEPRLLRTRTFSPFLMPFSSASSSDISTN